MPVSHHESGSDKPLRNKKKRSTVFLVIVVTIAVHIIALGGLAAIKIIEVLESKEAPKAPPTEEPESSAPPPPALPTNERTRKALPRPPPLAPQNPQNMDVPAIEMNDSDITIDAGRGFDGGLAGLDGAVADSIRIIGPLGGYEAMEGTLEGTLYDFKQNSQGQALKPIEGGNEKITYASGILKRFTGNFNRGELDRKFFKSDTLLYGAYFIIPSTPADVAPRAFNAEGVIAPELICAIYTGTYRPTESGRFRLFGRGDDVLVVRINGRTVLDGSWNKDTFSRWNQTASAKRADEANQESYFGLTPPGINGNWFELGKDKETRVEIVISEVPGGLFGSYILIEKEGQPGKQIFTTRPLGDKDKTFLRNLHPDAAQFIK